MHKGSSKFVKGKFRDSHVMKSETGVDLFLH